MQDSSWDSDFESEACPQIRHLENERLAGQERGDDVFLQFLEVEEGRGEGSGEGHGDLRRGSGGRGE